MAVIAPHDFLKLMKDDESPQTFPVGGDGNSLGFNMGGNKNNFASMGDEVLGCNANSLGSNDMVCNANSPVSNFGGGGTGGIRGFHGKPVVGGVTGIRGNHGKPVVGGTIIGTGTATGAGGKLMAFHMVCDAKALVVQKGGDGKPLAIQVGGQKVDVNQTVEIGLSNPKGIEIGKWAVLLHNRRERTNLQFVSIDGGWKGQVFAGMLYWLSITVKDKDDNNEIKNYEATVVDKPGRNVRVLLRFQLL